MPDYIYLLENRLSVDQQHTLRQLREVAREAGTILFLTGDAVRELTSGHAVRSLEVAIHGNALKQKKSIENLGGIIWGEDEAAQALYLCFPGTVRVDLISTHRVEYPKPGKAVYQPATIQEDLRRRDFTVNAMALSLNEGSFGLLMDPMNGAADIESRTLRLVSNYGFLEEPSLLIRATRYIARLGWEMDPRTRTRYLNAKEDGVIGYLSTQTRSQELEQIGHEEEGLSTLQALEAEGWMQVLFPAWTSAKADAEGLTALHDLAVELLLQGVHADMSAAQMRLLTTRLTTKELTALKKLMLRPGFVDEWNSLDAMAAGFSKVLLAKENTTPSASYKLFTSYDPEAVLWLGFTSKDEAVKERFNLFLKVWPEVRQSIPYALMQELRITTELPAYSEIVQKVFMELLDGKLGTPEEARAFLEPFSPPAPPPQVTIKRTRAKRGAEAKLKEDAFEDEEAEEALDEEDDLDDIGGDEDDLDLGLNLPKIDLDIDLIEEADTAAVEDEEDEEEEDPLEATPEPALITAKGTHTPKPSAEARHAKPSPPSPAPPVEAMKPAAEPVILKPEKPEDTVTPKPKTQPKPEAKPAAAPKVKHAMAAAKPSRPIAKPNSKPAPVKSAPAPAKKSAPPAKPAPKKAPPKAPVKPMAKQTKAAQETAAKASAKASAARPAPAKKKPVPAPVSKPAKANKPSKPAVKKPASKPARKR